MALERNLAKGTERPSMTRSKHMGKTPALSAKIFDGLEPYLEGMLKTIGQAGAGPKRRGKGSIKAAIDGLKLLVDSMGKRPEDSQIAALFKELNSVNPDSEDEDEWEDDDVDEDLEKLNIEIDNVGGNVNS